VGMTAPLPPFRRQTATCPVSTLNTRAYKAVTDQLMTWGVYTGRTVAAVATGGSRGARRGDDLLSTGKENVLKKF
jgi:hypothetical protein